MVRSWNPGNRETCFSSPNVQTSSGTHPASYSMGVHCGVLYIYMSTALQTIRHYASEVSGTDGEEKWLSSVGGLGTSNPGPPMP